MPTTLTITFSPEDRKFVEPVAKAKGMKLGPFVRQAALDAAGENDAALAAAVGEVAEVDRSVKADDPGSTPGAAASAPKFIEIDNNHRDRGLNPDHRGMSLNDPPESGWSLPTVAELSDLIHVPPEVAQKCLDNDRVSRDEEGHLRVNGVLVEEE